MTEHNWKTHGLSVKNVGADLSREEVEFALAMDRYKRDHSRPFPTWHEVLAVLKSLGYEKR